MQLATLVELKLETHSIGCGQQKLKIQTIKKNKVTLLKIPSVPKWAFTLSVKEARRAASFPKFRRFLQKKVEDEKGNLTSY